jgi:nitrogen fixation/metabolism regulation signal transduction histidine kinase
MADVRKVLVRERWLLAIMFAALVAAILLMADATQSVAYFGRLHNLLLPINTTLLVVFIALIVYNIGRLIGRLRRQAPGAKLTLRLVLLFVLTASMPVFIVYTFSIWLLERGVDSWFDVKVESALQDAVDLSRASLDLHIRTLRQQAEPLVSEFIDADSFNATLLINDLLGTTGAAEIALFDSNTRIIASGNAEPSAAVPQLPAESVLQLVLQGESYVTLDPTSDARLQIRMVYPVPSDSAAGETRLLQFLYPVSDRIGNLASNVQDAFGQYNELIYLRTPLKQNFILVLTLVLALGALFAVFAAFYWSRVLVAPIQELAEGTKAVAAGQYHKKLPVRQHDDLGMLVVSFNRMTERLTVARDTTIINQRIIENQRTYLQTILEHLSSGVMSLDSSFALKTINAASSEIFNINMSQFIGRQFVQIGTTHNFLKDFCTLVASKIRETTEEWQVEMEIFTPQGRKTILCKTVKLPSEEESQRGCVLVFDDVTTLLQAQRDSAWGEVARRLAHEIKNPLTPIQLSAERLRRKLLPNLAPEQSELVDRATHTIVQQVESMKLMVNDFSDYARMPTMEPTPLDINSLVLDTVELYKGDQKSVDIQLDLDTNSLNIRGDSVRLRQVIHNLIKNAIESMPEGEKCTLTINTFPFEYTNAKYAGIEIADNGPGFPTDVLGRAFDPYMTTKPKGNGLGLAIVKKIIEEHNGVIRATNQKQGGAAINIRFPLYNYGVKKGQEKLRVETT